MSVVRVICLIPGIAGGLMFLTTFHLISFPDVKAPILVLQTLGAWASDDKSGMIASTAARCGDLFVRAYKYQLKVPSNGDQEMTLAASRCHCTVAGLEPR